MAPTGPRFGAAVTLLSSAQAAPPAAGLPFFNFSSDLSDEPAFQQVRDLFQ
jgi:hypothetical protein